MKRLFLAAALALAPTVTVEVDAVLVERLDRPEHPDAAVRPGGAVATPLGVRVAQHVERGHDVLPSLCRRRSHPYVPAHVVP